MSTIIEQLETSVSARKDSLIALRARIEKLLVPIPVGVILSDDAGELCRVLRICTGASQWSNRTWDVTITGKAFVVTKTHILAEDLDRSYWDGNNMHHHSSEPFCLGRDSEDGTLSWLSGSETRALAVRLPGAIARYMAECEAERTANDAVSV